jgi:biofilm PGA synthesis N-glycosyltransferase PgaC
VRALWMQRKRWARGQGEVLHVHFGQVIRWRNHRMWLLFFESVASLLWVAALGASLLLAVVSSLLPSGSDLFGFGLAWGVSIAVVATVQMVVALTLERSYDRRIFRALLIAVVYPLAYWTMSAAAALRSEVAAALRGPRGQRVVWDVQRERH